MRTNVPDYLVSIPDRRGAAPPPLSYVISGPSRDDVLRAFPCFANAEILELPNERPDWLSDYTLDALEKNLRHVLGGDEPPWLRELVRHLARGDTYRWYALKRSLPDGSTTALGTLGTWRVPSVGETFSVPHSNRPYASDELQPGSIPDFEVLRVTVEKIQPATSDDLDGELLVRVLDT